MGEFEGDVRGELPSVRVGQENGADVGEERERHIENWAFVELLQ